MKKTIYILFLMAGTGLYSCTDMGEPDLTPQENIAAEHSKFRSDAELINIAVQGYELLNGTPFNHSNSRGLNSITITPIVTHNSRGLCDTLIQVVNYGEEQGFALVGALKGSDDLLAVIESGDYNPEETAQVDGFNEFVNRAQSRISSKPNIGDSAFCWLNTKVEREYNLTNIYGPHIATQWGQMEEFGVYCPNGICGCVPLATAMAMSHLNAPASMQFSFPEKDLTSAYFDWATMKSHFRRHSDVWPDEWYGLDLPDAEDCPADQYTHSNLGRVVRQIGYHIDAIYKPDATGAFTVDAVNYLKELIPDIRVSTFSTPDNSLISGLKTGVAITRGTRIDEHSKKYGHCWITDGCMILSIVERTYRNYAPDTIEGDWRLINSQSEMKEMLHFNWGWDGMCNGYFFLDCYDSNDGYQYDPGSTNPSMNRDYKYETTFYLVR